MLSGDFDEFISKATRTGAISMLELKSNFLQGNDLLLMKA